MFLIDKPRRFKRIFTKYPSSAVQVIESIYWDYGGTLIPGVEVYTREEFRLLPYDIQVKTLTTYADKIIFACGKEVTEF